MVDDPKDPRNRAERIAGRFNQAQEGQQPQAREPAKEQHTPTIQPQLRPRGMGENEVDRKAHTERAERLAKAVQERNRESERSKEKDRDR